MPQHDGEGQQRTHGLEGALHRHVALVRRGEDLEIQNGGRSGQPHEQAQDQHHSGRPLRRRSVETVTLTEPHSGQVTHDNQQRAEQDGALGGGDEGRPRHRGEIATQHNGR